MAGARSSSARVRRALTGLVACVAMVPAAAGLIVPANAPTGPRVSPHRFWALDVSAGAGSISAPYIAEHIVSNVTDAAVTWEKVGSGVASRLPRWLLLSIIGVVTRELTSREVRETLVPALITSGEAQPKAKLLTSKLRRSLDTRVSKVIAGGGFTYGISGGELDSPSRVVEKFFEDELQQVRPPNSANSSVISADFAVISADAFLISANSTCSV